VAAVLAALALVAAGCETIQYDNGMGSCSTSDGKYEITIDAQRDSDQTKNDVSLPQFERACRDIGATSPGTRSYTP
jgi:hypothetical protein